MRLESVRGVFESDNGGSQTHEGPVAPEEVLGQGVEGNVGARALSVVVGAGELGAASGETTTGNSGQTGASGGGSVHLCRVSEFAVTAIVPIALKSTYLGGTKRRERTIGNGRSQSEHPRCGMGRFRSRDFKSRDSPFRV